MLDHFKRIDPVQAYVTMPVARIDSSILKSNAIHWRFHQRFKATHVAVVCIYFKRKVTFFFWNNQTKNTPKIYYLLIYKSNGIQQIEPISLTNHIVVQLLVYVTCLIQQFQCQNSPLLKWRGNQNLIRTMRSIAEPTPHTTSQPLQQENRFALRKLFARRMLHYRLQTMDPSQTEIFMRNIHAFAHNPHTCGDWILFRKVLRKMKFQTFFLRNCEA